MRTHLSSKQASAGVAFLYFVAILATFFLGAFLIWATKQYTQPDAIATNRAVERAENLSKAETIASVMLNDYAWQDTEKGFLRVPIQRGIELVLKEWKNPAEGRGKLITLMEKATALPPPPPEEPSAFE
ncbi:MAG: hypothetical protein P8L18_17750 [Verrucomicrobiota bacterium]|nr:hypothetical protein [Verrucomicrobiota bacterium]MDG1893149.1 hypothetical protein [Verrucomicrobiota bacterium]